MSLEKYYNPIAPFGLYYIEWRTRKLVLRATDPFFVSPFSFAGIFLKISKKKLQIYFGSTTIMYNIYIEIKNQKIRIYNSKQILIYIIKYRLSNL